MSLGALTWPQVAERRGDVLVAVPVGSCEQHGPHLPLTTDSVVVAALCASLDARREDLVVAPLVAVGASGEHEGFAGTLSVGTDFLAAYLTEIVRSARAWSRGVVLVSGHGGNLDALRAVERTAREEGDVVEVYLARVRAGDAHAGRTETSLLLALAPELVRQDEAVRGVTEPLSTLVDALREGGVAAVSSNGVLGDPAGASAEEGVALFDTMVAELAERVDAVFGCR